MTARPRKILVGYDGSEAAKRALETAADLAGYGSTLAVVSVASNGGDGLATALAEAHERLLRRHVTATYLRPVGDPAEELLEAARALSADLLVLGRRNGGPRRRGSSLGAVSGAVVRRAPCDVLVVSGPPATPR